MKLSDIIKVISQELGTSDLNDINKLLKKNEDLKFRISGKSLGHTGFKGQIKSLSEEGVKVYLVNKVSLIRLEDIQGFEKAKPRVERPVRSTKAVEKTRSKQSGKSSGNKDSDSKGKGASKESSKETSKVVSKESSRAAVNPASKQTSKGSVNPASRKDKPAFANSKSLAAVKRKLRDLDDDLDDEDDFDDDGDFEFEIPEKEQRPKRHKLKPPGKEGSKFIPANKKK